MKVQEWLKARLHMRFLSCFFNATFVDIAGVLNMFKDFQKTYSKNRSWLTRTIWSQGLAQEKICSDVRQKLYQNRIANAFDALFVRATLKTGGAYWKRSTYWQTFILLEKRRLLEGERKMKSLRTVSGETKSDIDHFHRYGLKRTGLLHRFTSTWYIPKTVPQKYSNKEKRIILYLLLKNWQ